MGFSPPPSGRGGVVFLTNKPTTQEYIEFCIRASSLKIATQQGQGSAKILGTEHRYSPIRLVPGGFWTGGQPKMGRRFRYVEESEGSWNGDFRCEYLSLNYEGGKLIEENSCILVGTA